MASREIKDLRPEMQVLFNKFNDKVRRDPWFQRNGISLLLTCTYRSEEEQSQLYARGRTAPGPIVTNAKAGQSKHNATTPQGAPAASAFDVVPLRHGKPIWGTTGAGTNEDDSDDATNDLEVWQRLGSHGMSVGLAWAGMWVKFKEYPHFEMKDGA